MGKGSVLQSPFQNIFQVPQDVSWRLDQGLSHNSEPEHQPECRPHAQGTLKSPACPQMLGPFVYRARQKNASQVKRIVQARQGRSGKQQQEQNSRNLGTVFFAGPCRR